MSLDWAFEYLGLATMAEGQTVKLGPYPMTLTDGILRYHSPLSESQKATVAAFSYKWGKAASWQSEAMRARKRAWMIERFGDVAAAAWWSDYGENPILVDAGCGAGFSTLAFLGDRLPHVRYLGVDVSNAVDAARDRFHAAGLRGAFMQADVSCAPLPKAGADVIYSEGVLHHTDSTQNAFEHLASCLKPGGRFLLYVYRRKGPIREFTDDYVRNRLASLSDEEAWAALEPLSRLGVTLGELDIEIDIAEPIEVLGIPAGRHNLQRLFYWHVCKAFYGPELSLDETVHINFDWFRPPNAHRHTLEELRKWSADCGLDVERETVEDAGISIIARRQG